MSRFMLVPLFDKSGSVIQTAMIDPDDEWVMQWRWFLVKGKTHPIGYATRRTTNDWGKQERIYMHRLLLGVTDRKIQVDHRSHDTLDNRRANLRMGTAATNQQNRGGCRNGQWGRGVTFDKRRGVWSARCTIEGRSVWLGYHPTPEQASQAAAAFRAEHMPWSPEAEAVKA